MRRRCSSAARGRAGRCCSRRASSGGTAGFEDFRARVPRRRPGAAASSCGSGSTARSTGCARSARPSCAEETGNPLTTGVRFDPRGLVADARRARAGGGQARRASSRRESRAAPCSRPAASRRRASSSRATSAGRAAAAARQPVVDGRRARARARARRGALGGHGRVLRPRDARGGVGGGRLRAGGAARTRATRGSSTSAASEFFRAEDVSWSETNVVQAIARRAGARAYYLLDAAASTQRVRERTVRELVEAAPPEARVAARPAPVRGAAGHGRRRARDAAITHTIGGLRVDDGRACWTGGRADPGPLGRGRRRGRRRDRRLRERARAGARPRARGGGVGPVVTAG